MKEEKLTKREIKEVAARYPRFIRWSDEDGCYVGSLPDLNGECTHGDSREQVAANLVECAELYVELMNDMGFPLPEPARSGRTNEGQEEGRMLCRAGMGEGERG